MKCIRNIDELSQLRGGAVTIGNFDGVHRGHRRIIERLRAQAAKHHGPAIVFTFDPHPVRLLRPEQAPPPLTWTDRKAALLAELGVDALIAYPMSIQLLRQTPQTFFDQIIIEQLDTQAMVEGPNFFFGHNRAGNVELLRNLCDANAIDIEIVQPLQEGGELVSSSRIRTAIAEGDVDAAHAMLTEPYRARGIVAHGAARGATIGSPTANLTAIDTLIPAVGVYAGRAYTADGEQYPAAISIGTNPTFDDNTSKVEVHLLDFEGDLYGQPLEIDFLKRLRGIVKFKDADALKEQLRRDVAATRKAQK